MRTQDTSTVAKAMVDRERRTQEKPLLIKPKIGIRKMFEKRVGLIINEVVIRVGPFTAFCVLPVLSPAFGGIEGRPACYREGM